MPWNTNFEEMAKKSLPARGAWIEIKLERLFLRRVSVAPRTGSVD